jgi:hypothetical protein
MDANVTGTGLPFCLVIAVNNVTLLLNGHTIRHSPGNPRSMGSTGIEVTGGIGFGATILGPGTVSGWQGGIDLLGGGGTVRGVTATKNDEGIDVASANNSVRGNVTTDNGIGIGVGGAGNTIIGNFAHWNSFFDLADGLFFGNCVHNVWRGNDFGTANQSCIH